MYRITHIMGLLAWVIGSILILYGFYGVIKKKIFFIGAMRARDRYTFEAAKNKPFSKKTESKNYFIYGTWAIIEGIILIIIGVIVIFANI